MFFFFFLLNSAFHFKLPQREVLTLSFCCLFSFGENLLQSWKSSHKVSRCALFVGPAHWEPPPSECVAGWTAMTCSWELWTVKLCSFHRRLDSPVGGRHQWVCYTMSPQHAMSQQVITVQSQPLNSTASNYYNEELQMQRNVFAFEPLTFPLSLFLFSLFWVLFWKKKHAADGFFSSSKWREAPAANGERRR